MQLAIFGAPWKSSFREYTPGSSTFIPQVTESCWKAKNVLQCPMRRPTTDKIIWNCQRMMKMRFGDDVFDSVQADLHQSSLIRGDGLWEPQGCAHDKGFRRSTSMKFECRFARNIHFMIHRGCKPLFTETWVSLENSKSFLQCY